MIYGDTDSIMIYSGLDDIAKAKAISGKVIQEVGFSFQIKDFLKVKMKFRTLAQCPVKMHVFRLC